MRLRDPVYGGARIEEEVLQELIESDPVQRLKNINQAGPSPLFMEKKPVVKRYDHSIGVMLLLRENNASLEEQIAGLLHDVPHTAFSHVADFLFETEDHEYHEKFKDELIKDSKIPEILDNHGIDQEYVLDEENFRLLERDLPRLCADRLDYSMRDLKKHGMTDVEKFRCSLKTVDNEFVFDSFDVAEEFAEKFIELDREVYASPREVAIYQLFSEILEEMIENGELTEKELFKTDEYVLRKIRDSEDGRVKDLLELLDSGIEFETGAKNPDFIATTKARAVDPPFMENGEKIQVSRRSEEINKKINQHLDKVNSGYRINVKGYTS